MLELTGISKNYGRFAITGIDLSVARGEYFILLGRSGSGKSQLLEIISGLRNADSGKIILNGRDITREKIQNRKVGLVFQDYAIFPHMSVFDNIAYPLKISRKGKQEICSSVESIAADVNISHLLDRPVDLLSGGERQRVAVARTLVTSPDIILLDEPMASIDTPLKDDLRRLLRKINGSGMTILHVTHDFNESIRLADRVGVIHNGRIIQTGEPADVFANPANRFVARFAGIRNFYKVDTGNHDGMITGRSNNNSFTLPRGEYGEHTIIMIRSGDIRVGKSGKSLYDCDNIIKGVVTELNRAETGFEIYVDSGDIFHVLISEEMKNEFNLMVGQPVHIGFCSEDIRVI